VLRIQKATGIPVSRGMDRTINAMLDQLEELKSNNNPPKPAKEPQNSNSEPIELQCMCDSDDLAKIKDKKAEKNGR